MCSCPRSEGPGDTGAPREQPSEVAPPAPGLSVIATPDPETPLRSWGSLTGSVPGSAGLPAAAVPPGTVPGGARCHPSAPKPAASHSAPHSAKNPGPPAPRRGASGSGGILGGSSGAPQHRFRALSPSPSPKFGIFSPKVGVRVLPTAPKASGAAHPRSMCAKAQLDFAHLVGFWWLQQREEPRGPSQQQLRIPECRGGDTGLK